MGATKSRPIYLQYSEFQASQNRVNLCLIKEKKNNLKKHYTYFKLDYIEKIFILMKEYIAKYLTLELSLLIHFTIYFPQKLFKENHTKKYVLLDEGHGYI